MSKFNVGDWVRLREGLEFGKYYGRDFFISDMKFDGARKIERVLGDSYHLCEDPTCYIYTDEMLEPAEAPVTKCDGDSCEIDYGEEVDALEDETPCASCAFKATPVYKSPCSECTDNDKYQEYVEAEPASLPPTGHTKPPRKVADLPDSGTRREFSTGAVRDMAEGKGRCDLLPLAEVGELLGQIGLGRSPIQELAAFLENPVKDNVSHLYRALLRLCDDALNEGTDTTFLFRSVPAMLLEVAKHFEAGAKKYGGNNWRKGIPARCYVDSAIRHYLKYLDGWTDEPHDRAVAWNILCCIWEVTNHDQSIYDT